MNGDSAIHESNELNNKMNAYVILVNIEDWKVPPIEVHKAEQAAAPQHDANDDIGINGNDIAAPIVVFEMIQMLYRKFSGHI